MLKFECEVGVCDEKSMANAIDSVSIFGCELADCVKKLHGKCCRLECQNVNMNRKVHGKCHGLSYQSSDIRVENYDMEAVSFLSKQHFTT